MPVLPAHQIGVIRQFTFSSNLKRMSVITQTLGSNTFDVFVKGAPEIVASLCLEESSKFSQHLSNNPSTLSPIHPFIAPSIYQSSHTYPFIHRFTHSIIDQVIKSFHPPINPLSHPSINPCTLPVILSFIYPTILQNINSSIFFM